MDEERVERDLAAANGEAIFAGLNVAAIWTTLVDQGLVPPERAVSSINAVLLALEQWEHASPHGPDVLEHVKSRAKALAERCSQMTPR